VDLLAYRLIKGNAAPKDMVPIQVKSYSSTGYKFMKSWFHVAPGLVLVSVWHVVTTPQCHVFGSIADVEDALGKHANSPSWTVKRRLLGDVARAGCRRKSRAALRQVAADC